MDKVACFLWLTTFWTDEEAKYLDDYDFIERQVREYNTYLNDPEWKVYAYEQKIAYKFPSTAFSKALSYVLATAGA